MPNYQPNYMYSPKYGTRYLGQRTPAPAQGGIGQADPLSSPVNYEAGMNTAQSSGSISTGGGASVPAMGNMGVPQVMGTDMGGPYGSAGTGRDQSAISNLGDFGFRHNTVADDPFDDDYFNPPTGGTGGYNPPAVAPVPVSSTTSSSGGGSQEVPPSWSTIDTNPTSSGYQVYSGNYYTPGNYNIAGSSENGGLDFEGNKAGYSGNGLVQTGMGLKDYSNLLGPLSFLLPGGMLAGAIGDKMIGHDTTNINGVGEVSTTRGSFTPGQFTSSGGTDISGGATGTNAAKDALGNTVSLGYGFGQVDPAIARASGFTDLQTLSQEKLAEDTAIKEAALAEGVDVSSMTPEEAVVATEKAKEERIIREEQERQAEVARQAQIAKERSYNTTDTSSGSDYNWGSASSSSRSSSALGGSSTSTSNVGSRGGNASRGYSSGGW